MAKWHKIVPFFLLLALLACTEKIEIRIPPRPVYLELDIDFQDKALKAIQAHKIYTEKDTDQEGERTGFGGVLVFHGLSSNGSDTFYAFDAACPHEASPNVRVAIDESAVYAICPKCGSKFEVLNGFGNPVAGPCAQEKQGLKRYKVSVERNKIYIFN